MNYRILLVEDEEHLQEAIALNLKMEGFTVTAVSDGVDALKAFKEERFNLIILDIMLPEIDGLQVCETIRLENTEVPILFLTAKNTSEDIVIGLKKGADDYLTKPFNLDEFLLRVKILLKRSVPFSQPKEDLDIFTFGKNKVNFKTFEASKGENTFFLTKKEVMLLKLLIERESQVVSRDLILEEVWGYDVYPSTRTVDNFILALRKYFEEDPRKPVYFHTIRSVGYKFVNKSK
ncbi:MAG: DNA-binding response regulator [Calditrichaeota bacterium]|nr:MAG: DNA-binding response regulator [Calditrichota bacterium]